MILGRFGISLLAFCLSMIFSDLPSPAEAPAGAKNGSQGFAQVENPRPLFGIMLGAAQLPHRGLT
jgi:hypothetical protein